jgi:Ribonuclease G/E
MTDLLDVDRPEGWGVRWDPGATDAGLDALSSALERAVDLAADLDAVRDRAVDDPGRLVAPTATAWVWFGRESRFALDERRREVLPTMTGHHRVKAASEAASAGVDFAEALCDPPGGESFPFGVVTDQFGPVEGDTVAIGHGKPDGRLVTLGRGEVVDRDVDGTVAVERTLSGGGTYDALGTRRERGDTALTKFREGRWWYPTVYRDSEGGHKGTYVNVCTPVEVFPDQVRYVDLHVDVVKHADGRVERVDDDELDAAVADGQVSEPLAEKARAVATSLENAL